MVQYVSLFGFGVVAYRGDWINRVSVGLGIRWLAIGLGTSAFVFWSAMRATSTETDIIQGGGFDGEALLWSALEAVICVGMVTGLVIVGRHFFNRSGRFLSAMAAASYAAYILHISFVIGFQAALEGTSIPTSIKFGGVALLGIAASFGVGHLSKHVPGLRRILGTGGS
jgi:peptidoglycan/LPS O-acetylase OafA/YrhL